MTISVRIIILVPRICKPPAGIIDIANRASVAISQPVDTLTITKPSTGCRCIHTHADVGVNLLLRLDVKHSGVVGPNARHRRVGIGGRIAWPGPPTAHFTSVLL